MASRVLESSDEESGDGGSALKMKLMQAMSPAPRSPIQPIGAVWEEACAHILCVNEMMGCLELATNQLTEVSALLLERVRIPEGLGTRRDGGLLIRRTSSGEDSPVAQVSHEDLVWVGEPMAEEVDGWFVDKAVRDAEWVAE